MADWKEMGTSDDLAKALGPELAKKAQEDAKETARLGKTVAAFTDAERRAFVRIIFGPSPLLDPTEDLSPASNFRAFTVFWLGNPSSPWPPDDNEHVFAKAVNDKDKLKFMVWLIKERQIVSDLVKSIWNVDIKLPEEVIS